MKQTDSNSELKKTVAIRAASYVKSNQIVGLGTGSTAAFFIQELGRRVREENLKIACVSTSFSSANLANINRLPSLPLEFRDRIDISVDGADEIDPARNLIKGGGAAHTREKLVHSMSNQFICIADSSKKVNKLGEKFAVPVECIPLSLNFVMRRLVELGGQPVLRLGSPMKDGPLVTDNGNLILDTKFDISDPAFLETEINKIPGVLDNGIFAHTKPSLVLIAGDSGIEEMS